MSKEELAYLEDLVKIKVGEEKRELYAREIAEILNYVKEVQDVDTSSLKSAEVQDGTPINVMRQDESLQSDHIDKALNNTNDKMGRLYKVGQVIK